jgi:hypothetical protein
VLSWLDGFFCSGFFCGGFAVFSDMLWWLGGFLCAFMAGQFFCGAAVFFFLLLMALALPSLVFSTFLEVIRD